MDRWQYLAISQERDRLGVPLNAAAVDAFVEALGLQEGDRVFDVGCGWGEMVLRIARRYPLRVSGSTSRPSSSRGEGAGGRAGLDGRVAFACEDGMAFRDPGPWALALCLQSTWVLGGFRADCARPRPEGRAGRAGGCGPAIRSRGGSGRLLPRDSRTCLPYRRGQRGDRGRGRARANRGVPERRCRNSTRGRRAGSRPFRGTSTSIPVIPNGRQSRSSWTAAAAIT